MLLFCYQRRAFNVIVSDLGRFSLFLVVLLLKCAFIVIVSDLNGFSMILVVLFAKVCIYCDCV